MICAYKGATKLSNVSTCEVQVNRVYNGVFSHPYYQAFQQYQPGAVIQIQPLISGMGLEPSLGFPV